MCCIHGICILAPGANASANMIFHPVSVKNKASLFWYYIKQIINVFIRAQGRNLCDDWGGGGGGCVYSYICVMPDRFLLKSTQIQEIRWAEHKYMNKHPSKLPF